MHTSKPVFTAQFHPEAFGGPTDTEVCMRTSILHQWKINVFGNVMPFFRSITALLKNKSRFTYFSFEWKSGLWNNNNL